MGRAKDIIVAPIDAKRSFDFVREHHYTHSVKTNAQVHFGVFLDGKLGGAMQFGPPIDRHKTAALVRNTKPRGMLELNRMAFTDDLPRNSESRALGVVMRLMRKELPTIRWVVSFADATQCGDGTIYRAAGFMLTAIRKNATVLRMPDGSTAFDKTLKNRARYGDLAAARRAGARPMLGYQMRYVYFLDPSAIGDLTVEPVPYSAIKDMGAAMYRGQRVGSIGDDAACIPAGGGRCNSDPDAPSVHARQGGR